MCRRFVAANTPSQKICYNTSVVRNAAQAVRKVRSLTYRSVVNRADGRHEDKEEVRRKREEVRNLPRFTTSGNLRRATKKNLLAFE